MRKSFLLSALLLCGCISPTVAIGSDEPEYARDSAVSFKAADSFVAFRELSLYQKQRREHGPNRPASPVT